MRIEIKTDPYHPAGIGKTGQVRRIRRLKLFPINDALFGVVKTSRFTGKAGKDSGTFVIPPGGRLEIGIVPTPKREKRKILVAEFDVTNISLVVGHSVYLRAGDFGIKQYDATDVKIVYRYVNTAKSQQDNSHSSPSE